MSKPKMIPNGALWGDYTKEDVIATFNDFVNNGKHNDELDSLRAKNAQLTSELAGQTHAKEEALGWWKAERERAEKAQSRADSLAVELVGVCEEIDTTRCCGNCIKYAFSLIKGHQFCSLNDNDKFMAASAFCAKHTSNRYTHKLTAKAKAILDREKVGE